VNRDVDSISSTLEDCSSVLQRLFPTSNLDQLKKMPREQLLEHLASTSPGQPQPASPLTPSLSEQPPTVSPDAANLEELQPMPEEGTDGTESRTSGVGGITDDINAFSSVMAVLRVILWLDPGAQDYFTRTPDVSNVPSREPSTSPEEDSQSDTEGNSKERTPSAWSEIPLINAYFDYVHPFVPLLDEQYFRNTYIAQKRKDPRWLLLLNTVLAMGGMAAASSCEDLGHVVYWKRASQHLTVETLGSIHIETVQALALLGGYYLHYLNKPHVANNLMGATLRIATALGLHRDYPEAMKSKSAGKTAYTIEMRRRVWWNLFIMDAWHGAALGRPAMGRMSIAISAKPPSETIEGSPALLAIVQENIRFCMISTKMEDALAVSPLIDAHERRILDESFLNWYNASSVQHSTPRANQAGEPQGVTMSKNVMRWRYLLWRIIIHRPVLLWYAMRRIPFSTLPPDKKSAITLCRDLAAELITDIAATWKGQKALQMAGWNATWNLYQTLMVPLLSLYSDPSDPVVVEESRKHVELGLAALQDLRNWSNIAQRSYEVVSRIYEASKRHRGRAPPPSLQQSVEFTPQANTYMGGPAGMPIDDRAGFAGMMGNMHPGMNAQSQDMLVDDMFDSLNWGTSVGDGYDQFGPPSGGLGQDYNMMGGWDWSANMPQYFDPVMMEGPPLDAVPGGNGNGGGGQGMDVGQQGQGQGYVGGNGR
jgi:hypothetical protein